jgi:predicted dehydrogenase
MITRRNFLKAGGVMTAGLAVNGLNVVQASNAASYARIAGSNRKVNLACVGIGNRGQDIIEEFDRTGLANIVALCDADLGAPHTQKMLSKFPKAKQFKDFRTMFDQMSGSIEAVAIAIPDHAHFPVSMLALSLGKHVYVEKPMARTFYEAELMMNAARRYKNVVTQVGNQGHSEANYFQFKAWQEAGIIKDVREVTAHMNSDRRWHKFDPAQYGVRYPKAEPIPETLDWDVWLATAQFHDYNKDYHYGQWRCWYDFGMGALGDWGAHILDTVHEFLDLGLPYEINPLKLEGHNDYYYPASTTLLFRFPERREMPAVDITWYDGVNNIPAVPAGYGTSDIDPNIPPVAGGKLQPSKLNPGKIIYSKELTFKGGSHGSTLSIIPKEAAKALASRLPDVPKSPSNHFANFLLACMEEEKTRSPFEIHGPLSQVFSLGVMAQRLNTKLLFDRRTRRITNTAFADAMLTQIPPRKNWEQYYQL